MLEWIQFLIGAGFITVGIITAGIATFGMYRFKYVLNRMHAAAMCDTLALASVMIGLMIIYGFCMATLKILLIILLLWLASPVSSHLISRLEVTINEDLEEECEVPEE
jgi:multicomponent Na+:H+ antiporter subunit G